jgi:hypothetical protein
MMLRSLTGFERAWAFAALGAIYPSHANARLSVGVCDLPLREYLRDLFASVPLTAAIGLRAAIWIVALAPPFVLGRMVTVMGLDAGERQSLVERLLSSPRYGVRQLLVALKAVGGLFFGGAAAVKAAIFDAGASESVSSPQLVPVTSLTTRLSRGGAHASPCR